MRELAAPVHVYHYSEGLGGDHWLAVHVGDGGSRKWALYAHRANRRVTLD